MSFFSARQGTVRGTSKLQLWSIAIWVALLWSCFIERSYLQHLSELQQMGPLGWLGPVANFALIVICIAALLRVHWARQGLRIAAGLVVIWIPLSARHEFSLWRQLAQSSPGTESSAELAMQAAMQQQLHQILGMDLVMKAVLLLFWLWLCWRLGRDDVVPYFDRRRGPRR
ncbi:hypothetical protein ACYJW8_11275 [Frateuria aurantia]